MKTHKLPTMYRLDSKGKMRVRKSIVRGTQNEATWTIKTGIQDGNLIQKDTLYTEGKQGRTAFEQAVFEAQSAHESKQKKEKYVENIEDATAGDDIELLKPMLAEDSGKLKEPPEFPYYMQPKLDGNRCMIRVEKDGTITKWSREGNTFYNLEHLDERLWHVARHFLVREKEIIFDGELFTFEMPFKDINGTLKSPKKNLEELNGRELEKAQDQLARRQKIQFWIYDVVTPRMFLSRVEVLDAINYQYGIPRGSTTLTAKQAPIVLTNTVLVKDQDEADDFHEKHIQDGYEGSIIRLPQGLYKHGRSRALLKRKDFKDAEFKIIRIDEMKKAPGQGVYICEGPNGQEFGATPKCSHEERKYIFEHPEEYIGKQLTVVFFEIYEDGTPRFPVGLRIREDK